MKLYILSFILLISTGYLIYNNYQMAQVIKEQDLLLKIKNIELTSYAQNRLKQLIKQGLTKKDATKIMEKEIIKEIKIKEKCKELLESKTDQSYKKNWGTNFKLGFQTGWHTDGIDFGLDSNLFFWKRLGFNIGLMTRGIDWTISYSLSGLWQIDNLQLFGGQIYTFDGYGRKLILGIRIPI